MNGLFSQVHRFITIHRAPFKIAAVYVALGCAWILVSDLLAQSIAGDRSLYTMLEISKGWLFVVISSAVIFFLVSKYQKTVLEKDRLLNDTSRMAKIGGWEYDAVTGRSVWTEETFRIHGMPVADSVSADDIFSGYHGKHRQAVEEAFRQARAHAQPFVLELEMLTARGEHRWVKFSGQPIVKNGTVVKIRGTIQDITEQTHQKTALRESEEKFRIVFEHSMSGMVVIMPGGEVREANDLLYTMLGYARRELEGTQFEDLVLPRDREVYRETVRKLLHNEGISGQCQVRLKEAAGKTIWAEVISVVYRDETGAPAYLVTQVDDITESMEASAELARYRGNLEELVHERTQKLDETARELKNANIRLEEADRLKSVFLASMSHELRTPLNSIIGFTGVLLMGMAGTLNGEQEKQLHMVQNSAQHLLNLINDILDITKIEAGKVDLSLERFALDEVVHETANMFSHEIEKKGLDLIIELPPGVILFSDRRRLKQILFNLVNNAIKFTDSGRITILATTLQHEMVEVRVRDTGIGIRKQDMKHLFLPFQQIDETFTKKHEGTGLGLNLVRNLCILLGGNASAVSQFGKGSEFIVRIPLTYRENADENNPDSRRQ